MLLDREMDEIGVDCELLGDTEFDTLSLTGTTLGVRTLTFVDNQKYIHLLQDNCVVLTLEKLAPLICNKGVCICKNPRITFFRIHNNLANNTEYRRKHFSTQIGSSCIISPLAYIAEYNVKIGDNVRIEEFVSIKENTVIGNDSIIRAGSIIGGEGFEFKRDDDIIMPVIHLGGVIIGNNVELQQLTAVDKAIYPWDDTVIEDYCKIDNLVHIAHAVKIKKRALVVANSLVGGRTIIEEDAWIGASATVINGITVGRNARVNIGAVATKNVSVGESVTGNFAIEHSRFIRNLKEAVEDSCTSAKKDI